MMASIMKKSERKYKITVSNGYRADGRKISKAKTITVPDSVSRRGIDQYVIHAAGKYANRASQTDTPGQTYSGGHSAMA